MPHNQVILVDEHDRPIGMEEKLKAHREGKLHRAFSIFVLYREEGKYLLLLQQRQHDKYHSGGLWTNSCCSHPAPGEGIISAGKRRLLEEMGVDIDLEEIGAFIYKEPVAKDLTEHEFDHVLMGVAASKNVVVNKLEVADFTWMELDAVSKDLTAHPQKYTVWFKQALDILREKLP